MATVGELIVNLKADTAAFAKQLKNASDLSFSTSREIDRSMAFIEKAAVGAGIALAGMAVASLKSTIDLGAHYANLSQQTGVAVETLSGLRLAEEAAGVSGEQVAKGLDKLNRAIFEAANVHTVKPGVLSYAEVFKLLNITVTDSSGKLRMTEDVLTQLAGRFAAMPDGPEKTALAMKLFGKAGAELIPLLDLGAEGLRRFKERAQEMGLVMSGKTAQAAHQLKENWDELTGSLRGWAESVAAPVIAGLAGIAEGVEAIHAKQAKGDWQTLSAPHAQFVGSVLGMDAEIKANEALKNVKIQVITIEDQWAAHAALAAQKSAKAAEDATKAAEKQAQSLSNMVAGLEKQVATLGMTRREMELYNAAELGAGPAVLAHVGALAQEISMFKSLQAMQTEKIQFPAEAPTDFFFKKIHDEIASGDLEKLGDAITATVSDPFLANLGEAITGFDQLGKNIEPPAKASYDLARGMQDFGRQAGSALKQAILSGESFGKVMEKLILDIGDLILKWTLFQPIQDMLAAGGSSGFFGSILSGLLNGFAAGGPVSAGNPIVVGEAGPEIFIPNAGGTIVPNGALAGMGGVNVVQNFDFRGTDASAVPRIREAAKQIEDRAVARAVVAVREMSLRTA